jgi:hypothetical protein
VRAGARRRRVEDHTLDETLIAVFIDFENLAIGARAMEGGDFQIQLVLKRLLEKGRLVYKRAYCDWSRYRTSATEFHRHGIDMMDIPQTKMSGKNSADIHMVVDAIDLAYAKPHIDVFALVSGDSDFSPLASKLKENDKRVIGCGVKSSTSDLLIASCDEFIYYDDLVREVKQKQVVPKSRARAKTTGKVTDKRQEAIDQLVEIVHSLERDYDPVWGSLVKQTLRRVHPGFNETYYGYASFAELMQDAGARGVLELEYDMVRGNYEVRTVRAGRR